MGNGEHRERSPRPEEDLKRDFGDAVIAASKGGNNTGLVNWRIYNLSSIRVGVLHSPHEPSFLAYFYPRISRKEPESIGTIFRLNRENSDPEAQVIKKFTRSTDEPLTKIMQSEALTSHMMADGENGIRLSDDIGITNAFIIDVGEEIKDKFRAQIEAHQLEDELGIPEIDIDEVKKVIDVLKMVHETEQESNWLTRKLKQKSIKRLIHEFTVFAA